MWDAPMRLFLLALITIFKTSFSCPSVVSNLCVCEDLHNGVRLDCSNSNGDEVIQVLRENQSLLGLVQRLTMHKANIHRLNASFLAGLYIKQLDLSHNQMVEIDENAFRGMSPVLQELILTHNNFTKIPVSALSSLPTLLRLDLSNNTITDLEENDTLPELTKLYDLNLGSNNICSVHSAIFQKIKSNIQTINLGHNCLRSVPSSAIRGLTQLQSLHMHHNQIGALEALNFLNLPVLNLLNLAANNITVVNRQAFLNVPTLRYIYLTDNRIQHLAKNQFATFEKMEMLDLTGNQIETLPTACLSKLPSLRQLYLGDNLISTIEKGAFANSSIVILVLSGNDLKELSDGILDGLPNLQQVSFKNNKISNVHQNAFYNAPSIVMVDLSENQIMDLSPSTFLAQLNLLLIDLSNNKIIRTPYAAFNRRVGTVLLKENPVVCTEKVHMIQDGMGVFIPTAEDLICGGKPKTLTTTSTTSGLIQMPKMSPKRQQNGTSRPSGAFQNGGLPLSTAEGPRKLLPSRPSTLNTKPVVSSSRSRGLVGSDIAHSMPQDNSEIFTSTEYEFEEDTRSESPEQIEKSDQVKTIYTTTLGPRVYTDIADNPNLVHPFPVPFLKRGPGMHQAVRIKSSTNAPQILNEHTLPPSIVIAPKTRSEQSSENNSVDDADKFEQFALQAEPSVEKNNIKTSSGSSVKRLASPTTIIIICLTTVGIVMIAVFIGMCVARHRQVERFTSSYADSSSVARTNAYVNAQTAAQMNMVYGSMGRDRTMSLQRDDAQPWLYNPGPNYCNYYK